MCKLVHTRATFVASQPCYEKTFCNSPPMLHFPLPSPMLHFSGERRITLSASRPGCSGIGSREMRKSNGSPLEVILPECDWVGDSAPLHPLDGHREAKGLLWHSGSWGLIPA
jgi:hypothetical protein